jgi:hypothetical protein
MSRWERVAMIIERSHKRDDLYYMKGDKITAVKGVLDEDTKMNNATGKERKKEGRHCFTRNLSMDREHAVA